jgi:hypothetical protein
MQKTVKYTIFKTRWGYFGLTATDKGLFQTYILVDEREKIKSQLLQNLPGSKYESGIIYIISSESGNPV